MEYQTIKKLKFDENDIVMEFMRYKGRKVLDQIEDLEEEKLIMEKEDVRFQIPSEIISITDGYEEKQEFCSFIEMKVSLEYSKKNTSRDYFFLWVEELTIENDDFTIIEREEDDLLCRVEDTIYHMLRGMFLYKFGK